MNEILTPLPLPLATVGRVSALVICSLSLFTPEKAFALPEPASLPAVRPNDSSSSPNELSTSRRRQGTTAMALHPPVVGRGALLSVLYHLTTVTPLRRIGGC